jgi:hypothetical protein
MDWPEALEIVIERSKGDQKFGHERWRVLTADEHPDHEIHRRKVLELAGQKMPELEPWQIPVEQQVMTQPQRCCGG